MLETRNNWKRIAESIAIIQIPQRSEKWLHKLSWAFSLLSMAMLFALVLVVCVDVVGRYCFQNALTGTSDIIVLMMVIIVFPGLAYCASEDGNVRVDVLLRYFPKRLQAALNIFSFFGSMFIVALIAWQLGARALKYIQSPPGLMTTYFQWPLSPFIFLASFACAVLFLELTVRFINSILRIKRGF
jgi:TRAP-type C4-dicarboxylate transport system permease small subunit